MNTLQMPKVLLALLMTGVIFSCKKKTEEIIVPVTEYVTIPASKEPAFRSAFDYSRLQATTPYDSLFLDASGAKTVDLAEGNTRLDMFTAINTELGKVSGANNQNLDSVLLKNMFEGSSFANGLLNSTGLSIKSVTAQSTSNPSVYTYFYKLFGSIDKASDSVNTVAIEGKPGKLAASTGTGKYLLDKDGLEIGQLVQKGLMGAFQYDYIANVLFSDSKLNSDNQHLVPGKKYTALEHVWDEAYATLTNKKVFYGNATPMGATPASSGERFIGSYGWEYGRTTTTNPEYLQIHPAFLRGRAAIINNDVAEAKKQANIIKTHFEKAMARAAVSYISRGHSNIDGGAGKHQLGEGLGFVYSLRYCKVHGGTDAFSDDLLNILIYSNTNGVWQLTPAKANQAIVKINTQFGL